MSKKTEFIEYLETVVNENEMTENVLSYWNAFKTKVEVEKPKFTDNGKLVMQFLQSLPDDADMMKARDIAEAMFLSSRTVSGCMRKLVSDGYVTKAGEDPVMYQLTDAGRTVTID